MKFVMVDGIKINITLKYENHKQSEYMETGTGTYTGANCMRRGRDYESITHMVMGYRRSFRGGLHNSRDLLLRKAEMLSAVGAELSDSDSVDNNRPAAVCLTRRQDYSSVSEDALSIEAASCLLAFTPSF